jgi:hypothetical protein
MSLPYCKLKYGFDASVSSGINSKGPVSYCSTVLLRPGRFTPKKRGTGTHWIGGWLGPRAGLDAVVRRKIPSPCQDTKHRSFSPEVRLGLSQILHAHNTLKLEYFNHKQRQRIQAIILVSTLSISARDLEQTAAVIRHSHTFRNVIRKLFKLYYFHIHSFPEL